MSNKKLFYTYKTVNLINGAYYYGKHVQNLGEIDDYLGSGKILKLAISKYGKENFKKEIIKFYNSLEDLAKGEKELILDEHIEDTKCYNLKRGGEGGTPYGQNHPMYGKKHSEESKKKMAESKIGVKHPDWRNKQKSEYTKGRIHSEESKKRMSEKKKENMNEDIKNKIRNGLKGNKNGIGNKGRSIKILCTNNNTVYKSIKEAQTVLSVNGKKISDNLKNKIDNADGYIFVYYENE